MRGLRFLLAVTVGMTILYLSAGGQAEALWYYRVIARNDTAAAQAEKLRVRDAVLSVCPDDAIELPDSFEAIKNAAESAAPCRVEIRPWSPDTETPPATTVYVTVGEGRGHNCWGVLYADSLLMAKAEDIPEEPDRVEFIWPIWSWLLSLLGF